ncbi:hypothetical protein BC938DRAFT_478395 [Jimgerdemannia flammicorona]|uniref:Uncharacterized protein n=1 Tax=Jimgerdemannia flammicorona TaxID=994334 RepID=A0A433QMZ1_9FUNG|nr:hypothetical protein BC938DRAFT_478395 [Jimgerdemannia flammicorona]
MTALVNYPHGQALDICPLSTAYSYWDSRDWNGQMSQHTRPLQTTADGQRLGLQSDLPRGTTVSIPSENGQRPENASPPMWDSRPRQMVSRWCASLRGVSVGRIVGSRERTRGGSIAKGQEVDIHDYTANGPHWDTRGEINPDQGNYWLNFNSRYAEPEEVYDLTHVR